MLVVDTYIHAEHGPVRKDTFDRMAITLEQSALQIARESFGRGYELEFLIEEGTLWERVRVFGPKLIRILEVVIVLDSAPSAIADLVEKSHRVGESIIEEFRNVTNTAPHQIIYKRTTSRDVNRLARIMRNVDALSSGNLSRADAARIRDRIIVDLAGLARSNPDDEGVQKLMDQLPTRHLPGFPETPPEAIEWLNDRQKKQGKFKEMAASDEVGRIEPEVRELPSWRAKARYYKKTRL